jgi:hypothetical protein
MQKGLLLVEGVKFLYVFCPENFYEKFSESTGKRLDIGVLGGRSGSLFDT